MIRLGLFLYDHLGGRARLPGSGKIDLRDDPAGAPLKPEFRTAFSYADCWVDDARLVVLNAKDAAERGAEILCRRRCVEAKRANGLWHATLRPAGGGRERVVRARCLVNATGPGYRASSPTTFDCPRSSGSGWSRAATSWCAGCAIIGIPTFSRTATAGSSSSSPRAAVFPDRHHRSRLCGRPRERRGLGRGDRLSVPRSRPLLQGPADPRAGVLELCRRAAALRRRLQRRLRGHARLRRRSRPVRGRPLLSVFGGKITTYRKLAEHALDKLKSVLGIEGEAWTESAPLPGGDLPRADFEAFLGALKSTYPWLPADLAGRYARAYGTRIERLLDGAGALKDLGEHLGDGLYEAEADYLVRHEWAMTEEDILWRRSSSGCTSATRPSCDCVPGCAPPIRRPGPEPGHDGATRQRKQTGRRRASADAARHVDTASASKRHRAKSTSVGEYADGRFIDAKETDGGSGWWP